MRYLILGLALLSLAACQHCGSMNFCRYDQISLGDKIVDVQRCNGPAFCVQTNQDGREEYIYVERTKNGPESGSQTHYFLIVESGEVVDKCMRCLDEPFDVIRFDAYEPF